MSDASTTDENTGETTAPAGDATTSGDDGSRRTRRLILGTIAGAVLLAGTVAGFVIGARNATPPGVVERFLAAAASGDSARAYAFVSLDTGADLTGDEFEQAMEAAPDIERFEVTGSQDAQVTATLTLDGTEHEVTFQLVQDGYEWRIEGVEASDPVARQAVGFPAS